MDNTTPLSVNFRALRALGVWPVAKGKDPLPLKILYGLYVTFVVLFVQLLYIILELTDAVRSWGNLEAVTENICLSITHVAGIIKVINFLIRRNEMQKCLELLESMPEISGARGRPDIQEIEKEIITNAEKHAMLIFSLFFGLVGTTALLGMLVAGVFDPSIPVYKFPYKAWVPPGTPYMVSYLYLSICAALNAIIIVSLDSTFMGLMIHVCAQLKILEICLRTIGNEDVEDKTTNNHQELMYQELSCCVQHHQAVIKLCSEIEGLFSGVVLLQFLTSLGIIGITGFQAIVNLEDIFGHLTLYAYLLCILSEILIYCWFANQITLQSENVTSSAYESGWTDAGLKFRRSLLILTTRSQRPLQLTAGGFATLSLDTFTQILSRSYSGMAVLRQIYDDA